MTVLCDIEIAGLCRTAGLVKPFKEELVNPASIDVLLGDEIMVESRNSARLERLSIASFTEEDPYMLSPGEFILAQTQETFNLPENISAMFALKSSRAREGFDHCQSGWCDPGWSASVLTLELINARKRWPLGIYPGMKIGQMVFYRMSSAPRNTYAVTGNYNNHSTVMPSVA